MSKKITRRLMIAVVEFGPSKIVETLARVVRATIEQEMMGPNCCEELSIECFTNTREYQQICGTITDRSLHRNTPQQDDPIDSIFATIWGWPMPNYFLPAGTLPHEASPEQKARAKHLAYREGTAQAWALINQGNAGCSGTYLYCLPRKKWVQDFLCHVHNGDRSLIPSDESFEKFFAERAEHPHFFEDPPQKYHHFSRGDTRLAISSIVNLARDLYRTISRPYIRP